MLALSFAASALVRADDFADAGKARAAAARRVDGLTLAAAFTTSEPQL
jgi:hypothetical protein